MWSLKFGKVVLEILELVGPNCILEYAFILVQSLFLLSRAAHNRSFSVMFLRTCFLVYVCLLGVDDFSRVAQSVTFQ